jgi:hypothetical protein
MKGYDIVYTNRSVRRDIQSRTGTRPILGAETVYYCVSLDFRQIEAMARKAGGSKSGRCRDGALLVEVTTRRPL